MTTFRSRWDDWAPKEPNSRTDKTDKSPSVSFVSSSPGPFTGEIGHSDPQEDRRLLRRAHLAVAPDLSETEDIRVWLDERAGMREDSGIAHVDADKLAFDELLWIWHAANPVDLLPGQCAACGTAFQPPVMTLPDGAQVCDRPGHACLIAYGNGRRMAATTALKERGIKPPMWWEL